MDTSKPGPLLMLGGGSLMVIASFFNWRFDSIGVSTDAMGLFGIFTLLFGGAIAAVAAIRSFSSSTTLPTDLAGISLDKILTILAVTVFLWSFGLIGANEIQFGIHLTWIGAAVAAVGSLLTMREHDAPTTTI